MMRRKLKLGMLMVSSLSIVIVACGKKDGANYQRKRNDTGKVELDLKTAGDLLAKQIPDFKVEKLQTVENMRLAGRLEGIQFDTMDPVKGDAKESSQKGLLSLVITGAAPIKTSDIEINSKQFVVAYHTDIKDKCGTTKAGEFQVQMKCLNLKEQACSAALVQMQEIVIADKTNKVMSESYVILQREDKVFLPRWSSPSKLADGSGSLNNTQKALEARAIAAKDTTDAAKNVAAQEKLQKDLAAECKAQSAAPVPGADALPEKDVVPNGGQAESALDEPNKKPEGADAAKPEEKPATDSGSPNATLDGVSNGAGKNEEAKKESKDGDKKDATVGGSESKPAESKPAAAKPAEAPAPAPKTAAQPAAAKPSAAKQAAATAAVRAEVASKQKAEAGKNAAPAPAPKAAPKATAGQPPVPAPSAKPAEGKSAGNQPATKNSTLTPQEVQKMATTPRGIERIVEIDQQANGKSGLSRNDPTATK